MRVGFFGIMIRSSVLRVILLKNKMSEKNYRKEYIPATGSHVTIINLYSEPSLRRQTNEL